MNVRTHGRVAFVICLVALVSMFTYGCGSDDPAEPEAPFGVSSVSLVDENKVRVRYNRQLDAASAGDADNYTLTQDQTQITVHRADVQPDGRSVILATAAIDQAKVLEITIDSIKSADNESLPSATMGVDTDFESGIITTWAGDGRRAYDGEGNLIENSSFYLPANIAFLSSGTYVLDWNNHVVRRVTAQGTFEAVIGTGFVGDGPDDFGDRTPPGVQGTTIHLNHPTDVDEMPDGRVLLSSWHNHKLRIWDPTTGLAYVSAGEDPDFSGDGGDARTAEFSQPPHSHVLADGTIFVLDQRNQRIRRIDGTTNIITTAVGTGEAGYSGDGGPPSAAQIAFPSGANPNTAGGLAIDSQGRLYISDTLNNRIRRCDFGSNTIETVAGNGDADYSGDGGSAIAASLNNPRDIVIGPDGKLYIADEMNSVIRAVDLLSGVITTVAGNGTAGFSGDGGPATAAQLHWPGGIAFSPDGYLYIADTQNDRIRRVTP